MPAAASRTNSSAPVAFSPAASGTPVALRSVPSASTSSAGQIGSSTQSGSYGFIAITASCAASGSHAQLVSTMIGTPGPVASRVAATASVVFSCSLIWR